jgi:hypothetical protein
MAATGLVVVDFVSRSEDWALALLLDVGPGAPVSVDPGWQLDVGCGERHDLVRLTGPAMISRYSFGEATRAVYLSRTRRYLDESLRL